MSQNILGQGFNLTDYTFEMCLISNKGLCLSVPKGITVVSLLSHCMQTHQTIFCQLPAGDKQTHAVSCIRL